MSIYIEYFGLSKTAYSLFFATNAAASMAGPLVYIRIHGKVAPRKLITTAFSVSLCAGLSVLLLGRLRPLAFLLSFMPFSFCSSLIRPLTTSILLSQQEGDTGSASSLINFVNTAMGSVGMALGSLPWSNFVTGLGTIASSTSFLALTGWMLFQRSSLQLKGVMTGAAARPVSASE